jgi:hypothetical protein
MDVFLRLTSVALRRALIAAAFVFLAPQCYNPCAIWRGWVSFNANSRSNVEH